MDLSKVECKRVLRHLELSAYRNLVDVFRAQGRLTSDKHETLRSLATVLNIGKERFTAELRRAGNDNFLDAMAWCLTGQNTEMEWLQESFEELHSRPYFSPQTAFTALADSISDLVSKQNESLPEFPRDLTFVIDDKAEIIEHNSTVHNTTKFLESMLRNKCFRDNAIMAEIHKIGATRRRRRELASSNRRTMAVDEISVAATAEPTNTTATDTYSAVDPIIPAEFSKYFSSVNSTAASGSDPASAKSKPRTEKKEVKKNKEQSKEENVDKSQRQKRSVVEENIYSKVYFTNSRRRKARDKSPEKKKSESDSDKKQVVRNIKSKLSNDKYAAVRKSTGEPTKGKNSAGLTIENKRVEDVQESENIKSCEDGNSDKFVIEEDTSLVKEEESVVKSSEINANEEKIELSVENFEGFGNAERIQVAPRRFVNQTMQEAVRLVTEEKLSIRAAAMKTGVVFQTLYRYVAKRKINPGNDGNFPKGTQSAGFRYDVRDHYKSDLLKNDRPDHSEAGPAQVELKEQPSIECSQPSAVVPLVEECSKRKRDKLAIFSDRVPGVRKAAPRDEIKVTNFAMETSSRPLSEEDDGRRHKFNLIPASRRLKMLRKRAAVREAGGPVAKKPTSDTAEKPALPFSAENLAPLVTVEKPAPQIVVDDNTIHPNSVDESIRAQEAHEKTSFENLIEISSGSQLLEITSDEYPTLRPQLNSSMSKQSDLSERSVLAAVETTKLEERSSTTSESISGASCLPSDHFIPGNAPQGLSIDLTVDSSASSLPTTLELGSEDALNGESSIKVTTENSIKESVKELVLSLPEEPSGSPQTRLTVDSSSVKASTIDTSISDDTIPLSDKDNVISEDEVVTIEPPTILLDSNVDMTTPKTLKSFDFLSDTCIIDGVDRPLNATSQAFETVSKIPSTVALLCDSIGNTLTAACQETSQTDLTGMNKQHEMTTVQNVAGQSMNICQTKTNESDVSYVPAKAAPNFETPLQPAYVSPLKTTVQVVNTTVPIRPKTFLPTVRAVTKPIIIKTGTNLRNIPCLPTIEPSKFKSIQHICPSARKVIIKNPKLGINIRPKVVPISLLQPQIDTVVKLASLKKDAMSESNTSRMESVNDLTSNERYVDPGSSSSSSTDVEIVSVEDSKNMTADDEHSKPSNRLIEISNELNTSLESALIAERYGCEPYYSDEDYDNIDSD